MPWCPPPLPHAASQVGVIGSAADRGVDGPGGRALRAGEGHVFIQGVLGVRHAAAGAAPGPVQSRHIHPSRRRLLVGETVCCNLHPPLTSVLAAAAPADPNEHNSTGQDFEYSADEPQDDAVSDARLLERRHRRDVREDVGVPGDWYDGEDTRDEYQESAQTGHNPVRIVSPAADARDGHDQPEDGHHQGGHH